MSNFTPLVHQEFEFQGDIIKVTYSRLKRVDMLGVIPYMKKLGEVQGEMVMVDDLPTFPDADEEAQGEALREILDQLIDVLPDYVTSFKGLKDADGDAVEIKTVINEFYFLSLATQIAVQMISDSSATEGNV